MAAVARLEQPYHEASILIEAPPDTVWALIADVKRMGEWSPICRGCEWLEPSEHPEVGARFVGHSRLAGARWSRECVVTAAEPGREFGFSTLFRGKESTRWLYRLEPSGPGTLVSEAYERISVPRWVRVLSRIPGMRAKSERDNHRGMELTLTRVKVAAES